MLVDEAGARRSLAVQARAVGRIATVSAPVSEWVSRSLPDVDLRAKLVVAPNGVNTERISQVTFAPEPVVLFVGTLKPWHGVEDLLRAATLAERRWRIRIVGDGPQGPALRQLAGTAELDVEFAGAVAPQDVPAYLDGAWVAVAPYPARSDQYFSPLKVYEYSAAGLPVVASHVGQIPSVVADGVTGVLVPPSDPPALARAIDRLVADPVTARAMGRAGREQMLKTHTWHHALRTILGDELAESLTSEVVIA